MYQPYKKSQTRLLYVLIILNLVFLFIIIAYITGILPSFNKNIDTTITNRDSSELNISPSVITPISNEAETMQEVAVKEEISRESIIEKALDEILNEKLVDNNNSTDATQITKPVSNNLIEVFYDGKLARVEETDSEGNQLITIARSLDDIGDLSRNDASYVEALNELKNGTRSRITFDKKTIDSTSHTEKFSESDKTTDIYNKIEVKDPTSNATDRVTLADQITRIVSEQEIESPNTDISMNSENDDYIQTLKTASVERINEMRTIQVLRGDSLWDIAVKAYGSGYDYPRIYQANPHLTNPDQIVVGDILRVPL